MKTLEFYQRFEKIITSKNITIGELSKKTGIPYTTLDGIIKKKLNNIKLDNVFKIAKCLNVSVEYLATGKEEKSNDIELTKNEIELITLWRKLPEKEQQRELGRIEAKAEECATVEDDYIIKRA